ncbi:P-loop containing nucleoside triphosphate hydrolase protein [Mycena rosella]|uniref:P-loop containing nucleoside triphosphate hydrolase protein n=1 Tax=Mycena rosella TaxID=1033263 RepID=A0AAD7CWB7_MYCRO|nr:P-loop containing nucleoside triphosphate hydrolase protein [Mycena rosella]
MSHLPTPGGEFKDSVLKNVSLKIPAGSLVVIVGANGSGKSTMIKLLNRLYGVDSGEILVDGVPIKNYRISDLRSVQALLTQNHKLYPLTLAENIGLGESAPPAEAGSSTEVIGKLKDEVRTVLEPIKTARGTYLDKDKHSKLKSILEGLEVKAEVSGTHLTRSHMPLAQYHFQGGEKQRLVASRTFMLFMSGEILFAVADEPSSALDSKAEHRLFQRLREARAGKTLIFITHCFGHLVKHADLIIAGSRVTVRRCMKDGQAVESGTHTTLMARGGEYSELYNVQAQEFSDGTGQVQDN